MSTPVKPPGSPPSAPTGPNGDAGAVEHRDGEFGEMVDASSVTSTSNSAASATSGPASSGAIEGMVADLRAGRSDVEGVVQQLVDRALEGAPGLPDAHRAALETQLREALTEDPTLVALRKDLERAST